MIPVWNAGEGAWWTRKGRSLLILRNTFCCKVIEIANIDRAICQMIRNIVDVNYFSLGFGRIAQVQGQ